jgi:hypothetical protein
MSQLMLNKDSEILVYIKKILHKFASSTSRITPWFEQFEHVFLFQFIQVIHQEVNLKENYLFDKTRFSRNLKMICHQFITKFYLHYYHHF